MNSFVHVIFLHYHMWMHKQGEANKIRRMWLFLKKELIMKSFLSSFVRIITSCFLLRPRSFVGWYFYGQPLVVKGVAESGTNR